MFCLKDNFLMFQDLSLNCTIHQIRDDLTYRNVNPSAEVPLLYSELNPSDNLIHSGWDKDNSEYYPLLGTSW